MFPPFASAHRLAVLLQICSCLLLGASNRFQQPPAARPLYRLPEDTVPLRYRVKLTPNLRGNFNFSGEVCVDILAKKTTNVLRVHCKNLQINAIEIYNVPDDGARVNISSYSKLFGNDESLIVWTKSDLRENVEYRLRIVFSGLMQTQMVGLHRSSYQIGNQTKWLAATKFTPTYARMAFPCYDEPRFKTPFVISLARYSHQIAISNTPLESTSQPDSSVDGRVWDTFEQTLPIPTYAVGFVISEFLELSDPAKRISVWARENQIKSVAYALQESQKVLKYLEDYTDMAHILPKLHFVALPQFKTAATANWGLTIYREDYLLLDPQNFSEDAKIALTAIVAHELSHQWFGIYLTPVSWDYVWLSEGFATYVQYELMAKMKPQWRRKEYFVVDVTQYALYIDVRYIFIPLTSHADSSSEIEFLFGPIAYYKGASILRMVEHMVTTETFEKAWKKYLTNGYKKGGSVTPSDLWKELQILTQEDDVHLPAPVTSIMSPWTDNVGYPLVKVTRKPNSRNIIVEQETYQTDNPRVQIKKTQQWTIPLTFTTRTVLNFANTRPALWLRSNGGNLELDGFHDEDWVIFNIQQTGYYRVMYDAHNWKLLMKQLRDQPSVIHVLNRAQLIDDSFMLARDRKINYEIPFKMATYLAKEHDMIPWFAAMQTWKDLLNKYLYHEVAPQLKEFMTTCLQHQYNRIGFHPKNNDDHTTRMGRPLLLTMACALGLQDCVEQATRIHSENTNDLRKIHPDLKYVVLCTAMRRSKDSSVRDAITASYERSDDPSERKTLTAALACTSDVQQLKGLLKRSVYDDAEPYYLYQSVFHDLNSLLSGTNDNRISNRSRLLQGIIFNLNGSKPSKAHVRKLTSMVRHMRLDASELTQVNLLENIIEKLESLNNGDYAMLLLALEDLRVSLPPAVSNIEIAKEIRVALEQYSCSEQTNSVPTESVTPATSEATAENSSSTNASSSTVITYSVISVCSFAFLVVLFKPFRKLLLQTRWAHVVVIS